MKRPATLERRKASFQRLALACSLVIWGTAEASAPVHTVFSAENALYGAGYDIGKADGWIDAELRAGLRQYQSEHPGLSPSGNLDAGTLESLGIESVSAVTIKGNTLASRAETRAQLGLKETSRPPERAVIVAVPPVDKAPDDAQPKQSAAKSDAEPATESAPPTVAVETTPALPSDDIVTTEGREIAKNQDNRDDISIELSESNPGPQEPVKPEMLPKTTASETASQEELLARLPDEPTASGPAAPLAVAGEQDVSKDKDEARPESSGGFFSWLFDFFFGWMA
ncbi:peptidoglycan-binding protein [Marinobacter sp. VGCF2001]|uniref:peptidoglycan-binding domain-containing protein n=1 Tax=Marinobacter sp. VGCF2001 TaxID=3417189 RepID=UPI003CEBA360